MRFIINLPREELESLERVCFQIEEAQWFYEDFIRPLDPDLPSLNLKNFCLTIFRRCPMFSSLSSYDHAQAFSDFLDYKTRVPVRGAILLNEQMDSVVLVKGWKKNANWSFPRGKINKDELDLDCAVREVYEETGYDIKAAGLVGSEEETKNIEFDLREQHLRLYVFRGVPMDTYFEPRTRKEISKIAWYRLSDLPMIRKKKNQQEGKGEDLAVNANKFYMVAPFLGPLKQWISAQRKLDKVKQSGVQLNNTTVVEEPARVAYPSTEERNIIDPSNEDLGRLLDSLRKSAQPGKTSDLPEVSGVSGVSVEPKDITAQLKSVLGVPSMQTTNSATDDAGSTPVLTSRTEIQKSNALLALLRGEPVGQAEPSPQTPFEQVIGFPPPPASPHPPHHEPTRLSALPPPPIFPLPTTNNHSAEASSSQFAPPQASASQAPQPPQVRSIPPPRQPAQLVPRVSKLHQRPPPLANAKQPILAPYQRTGDPQFAQSSRPHGDTASFVPPASKLPPPKLTAQSSALLDLFKFGLPTKLPVANGESKASVKDDAQKTFANPSANAAAVPDILRDHEKVPSSANQIKSDTNRGPTSILMRPQTLPKVPSLTVNEIDRPKSEHQEKLLSLFRSPSIPAAEPVKSAANSLQPPSGPVELSALPMTPGHSREPSIVDPRSNDQASNIARNGSMKAQRRPRQDTSKAHNPTVSATVNGPLNIPQFDMLAQVSRETKHAAHDHAHKKSRQSPVTILSRKAGSPLHPPPISLTSVNADTPPSKQQKAAFIPQIQTLVSPVKDMPPTPNLKGRLFHPQILRRPATTDDPNEPSPIQPLPSPKHSLLANRTTQSADHKKSLLSLLTKPSPLTSPALTAPVSAIDPANVVSPLSEKPTPREQADAAFAQLTRDNRGLPQEPSGFLLQAAVSPSRTSSLKAVVDGGRGKERAKDDKKTPTPRTTPVDKNFLLGYLEGVANGGR